MKTADCPQSGSYADKVQITGNFQTETFRIDFTLGSGDVLLCLSSCFAPEPSVALLESLNEQQELKLRTQRKLDLVIDNCRLQLQLHPRAVLASQYQSFIELSVPQQLNLPLRVQLWSYDPKNECAAPNLEQNTVCLKACLSYSCSRNLFTGKTKVFISQIDLRGFPDGFLCYRVGRYEYPIPNVLLSEPLRLKQADVQIQATSPWQDCITVRREG